MIWSPEALEDVQRLYRFLAEKNPDAARRAASAIRDGMKIVADHPDVGRPVDDMDPEFQEWPISFGASGYVALYRLEKDVALVVAVRHQKEVGYQLS
nr:type II toxin-antitoxin system RelE/ParE family toxin [Sulfitobacter aestuariivivens]